MNFFIFFPLYTCWYMYMAYQKNYQVMKKVNPMLTICGELLRARRSPTLWGICQTRQIGEFDKFPLQQKKFSVGGCSPLGESPTENFCVLVKC